MVVIFAPNAFELITQQMKQWITDSFSWFYVLSVAIFLIVLIFIAMSEMGKIKLIQIIVNLNTAMVHGLRCYLLRAWVLD